MDIIKVFYDLETTGVDPRIHSIHQIAGLIEINDEIVEKFDFKVRPHPKAQFDEGALNTCRVTKSQLLGYPPMEDINREYKGLLGQYIDPYNTRQKAYNVGFNIRHFDDVFLRAWFKQCGDDFIGSWFWNDTLDVLVLASEYLIGRRHLMPSFKLRRVAIELGIVIDKDKLHDASYDVELAYKIYRIVTGRELEI